MGSDHYKETGRQPPTTDIKNVMMASLQLEFPVKLLSDWIARKSITFQFRNILFKLRFQGSRGMYFVVSTFQGPKIEMKLMDWLAAWLNSYL